MTFKITTLKQTGVFCETCARNMVGNEIIDDVKRRKKPEWTETLTKVEIARAEVKRTCRLSRFNLGK